MIKEVLGLARRATGAEPLNSDQLASEIDFTNTETPTKAQAIVKKSWFAGCFFATLIGGLPR